MNEERRPLYHVQRKPEDETDEPGYGGGSGGGYRRLTVPPPPKARARTFTNSSFHRSGGGGGVVVEGEGGGVGAETAYRRIYDGMLASGGYNAYDEPRSRASSLELSTSSSDFISIQGSDVTTQALELCEKWALKQYRAVLVGLGWIPPQAECYGPRLRKAIHIFLLIFWVVVIFGAFIAQILSCFRRDKFLAFHDHNTWKTYNISCHDLNYNSSLSDDDVTVTTDPTHDDEEGICYTLYCDHHHIFTDYILFDLLLLAVYVYGVYQFRSEECGDLSYLHTLASRAFVMNSVSSQVTTKKRSSNKSLLLTIMSLCIAGLGWIVISLIIRILTICSGHLMDHSVAIKWNTHIFYEGEKISLIMFSLVGFLFFDMVYVAAALNHAVQSELLVWLLNSIITLLRNKHYHSVDAAIKDILECRRYLRTLNGRAATSVALIIFIVGNMAILAVLTLNTMTSDYHVHNPFKLAVALLNIASWFALLSLPIIQATRVTRACDHLRDVTTEIRSRPLLYAETPQLELDSLILLTQSVKLRATLFGVPMTPALVYGVVAMTTFIVILLSQADNFFLDDI